MVRLSRLIEKFSITFFYLNRYIYLDTTISRINQCLKDDMIKKNSNLFQAYKNEYIDLIYLAKNKNDFELIWKFLDT